MGTLYTKRVYNDPETDKYLHFNYEGNFGFGLIGFVNTPLHFFSY